VIDEVGSVDAGSTQTDSLALERQRGITIKSAVASFAVGDVTVNLIDTPGHPDFIAEVERVLTVLDGAVLVISAVEGVQPQTRILHRALARLRIPTVIFVNKIDLAGAREDGVLADIAAKLTPEIAAMGATTGLGTRQAGFVPHQAGDEGFTAALRDLLADLDEEFLAAYVADPAAVPPRRLLARFAKQARRGSVHPVFFGSAMTGTGVAVLTAGLTRFLPYATGSPDGPARGTVFKVERGPAGEKVAYVRMFSGTLGIRDRVRSGAGHTGKVTALSVLRHGTAAPGRSVAAGQIGKLWGLAEVQIGDRLSPAETVPAEGPARSPATAQDPAHFAPPTLQTVVVPCRPADRGALHAALAQLAEQDPLINLRPGDTGGEPLLSLYGEVQKEVIQATLASDFGIEVGFRETTTICIERLTGTGEAAEVIAVPPNPFLATVGLRVEPAEGGTGVRFALGVELGSLPLSFVKAVEETVHATLAQGLYGWQVTGALVTMTQSGYWARQSHMHGTFDKSMSSTAGDFRNLTPLVLMAALAQAGTAVCEPMHRFHLEFPADVSGAVMPALGRLRAVPHVPATRGEVCLLDGDIPAASVHRLQQQLPALTRGEGVLESGFDHYQQARGPVPARVRAGPDPLNRKEYLLRVQRKV
jgi:ribosomal protection tetracycline resistance protein